MLAPQRRGWSQVSVCLMSVRMKVLVGCLKAETQWKYFVSLTDAWRMGWTRFRRGVTVRGAWDLLSAWCGSMPCRSEKVSNAVFYGGLHFNRRGIKKPRWFPPQAVETSAVKPGCSSCDQALMCRSPLTPAGKKPPCVTAALFR